MSTKKKLPKHSAECRKQNQHAGPWQFKYVANCPGCTRSLGKLLTPTQLYCRMGFTVTEANFLLRYDKECARWRRDDGNRNAISRMADEISGLTKTSFGKGAPEMPLGFPELVAKFSAAVASHDKTMRRLRSEDAELSAVHKSKKSPLTRLREMREKNAQKWQQEMEEAQRKWNPRRSRPPHSPLYRARTKSR